MPAQLPGSTVAENAANPSAGAFVIFDPLSGPKGSPLDKGLGTGALQTGIGFGQPGPFGPGEGNAPVKFNHLSFTDDYVPGISDTGSVETSPDSSRMYIGGGRSDAPANPGDGVATPNPYTDGVAICGAGNGGSRDGGAGPAFTGFSMKTVTATGAVANGAAVETGFTNRSGQSLVTGQSVFGSATTPLAAATLLEVEPEAVEPPPAPGPLVV